MRDRYRREKRLAPDGSFYKTNEELVNILGVSDMTFHRSKRRLQETGKIRCTTHQGRGLATVYFIPSNTPKETTPGVQKEAERLPLDKVTVKTFAKDFGRHKALSWFQNQGYTPEEIALSLD